MSKVRKPIKEYKGDGESSKEPNVVELKVDFHVLFMIDRKFTSRQEMQA
jgi:hypothetical protein